MLTKKGRLEIFYRKLNDALPASDEREALRLLSNILNSVEDEHTLIPYAPNNWSSDGRMYSPQSDSKRIETKDITRYRNTNHNTYIGSNGSIKIVTVKTKNVVLDKAGFDSRKVDEL